LTVQESQLISGTPLIDSFSANGDVYLIDAAGKVGAQVIADCFIHLALDSS
jgi:hypothetical protein